MEAAEGWLLPWDWLLMAPLLLMLVLFILRETVSIYLVKLNLMMSVSRERVMILCRVAQETVSPTRGAAVYKD